MKPIIEDIIDLLKEKYKKRDTPKIEEVFIGLGFTGVKVSDEVMGICFTPRTEAIDSCCLYFDKPGTLWKKDIFSVAEMGKSKNPLERVVGIATINALSQIIFREEEYLPNTRDDVLDLIPLLKSDRVVMVGNIGPFIDYIKGNSKHVTVIDNNPALQGKQDGYVVVNDLNVLKEADISIITGASMVYDTVDQVLELAQSSRHITMVGPSLGCLPEPLFERNIENAAGMHVTDVNKVRHIIFEGGGARQFSPYTKKFVFQKSLMI